MYSIFEKLCEERGVSVYRVCEETGIKSATFYSWKKGKYIPKQDKLQKIADYFGVSLEYLKTGKESETYYTNPETAAIAQEIYENKDLRLLFDASRNATPEQLKILHDMAMSWKSNESK